MSETQISLTAKNYADALIKLGHNNIDTYNKIMSDLKVVKKIFNSSSELTEVLKNPTIANETKDSILDEIFTSQIDQKIIDFIKILISKKRFNEFDGILESFEEQTNRINGIQNVEVISAIELNDDFKRRIVDKLKNRIQKEIIPTWKINEDIIAGLVIKIDDNIIDTSLKNKLENLSKNII